MNLPETSIPRRSFIERHFTPENRLAEVICGLIMVLTFTGSLSVAEAGRDDVRAMLIGALGCNLAWGLIDAVLFLMGSLAEKGNGVRALRAVRQTTDPQQAHQVIAGALPPLIASLLEPEEFEKLRSRLMQLPAPPERPHWDKDDWLGALGVFLLVFLSTLPVVIPFTFMERAHAAMRVSNAIAIGLLFVTGCAYGRVTGHRPWMVGVLMILLGTVLAVITMALGG